MKKVNKKTWHLSNPFHLTFNCVFCIFIQANSTVMHGPQCKKKKSLMIDTIMSKIYTEKIMWLHAVVIRGKRER